MNRIHTQQERLQARKTGERRSQLALVQLIAAVSILRTALTRLLPLAGCSTWWLTLLCLLPGGVLTALLSAVMRRVRASTLQEMVRCCLGRPGGWLVSLLMGGLLLLEGAAGLTALITLFTQGIGTSGTQLTMALLTGAVLLLSLHREGLPRSVYLLRGVMLIAALAAAASSLTGARMDHLSPYLGDGMPAVTAALQAGMGLSWPLLLILTVPHGAGRPAVSSASPVLLAVTAVLLVVCLAYPHELLIRCQGLAECLLLTAGQGSTALRLLSQCLLMLAFFLAIGGAVQLGTDSLAAPAGNPPGWLPFAALIALVATQAMNPAEIWRIIGLAEPWLLSPFAGLAAISLPIAILRRKRT